MGQCCLDELERALQGTVDTGFISREISSCQTRQEPMSLIYGEVANTEAGKLMKAS